MAGCSLHEGPGNQGDFLCFCLLIVGVSLSRCLLSSPTFRGGDYFARAEQPCFLNSPAHWYGGFSSLVLTALLEGMVFDACGGLFAAVSPGSPSGSQCPVSANA